jgi:uncharacterized protein
LDEAFRPLPVADEDDEFFWSNLVKQLVLPYCQSCGFVWLRPAPGCPRCGSGDLSTRAQNGLGTVYTWVVVNRALDPAFAAEVPYTVLTVELECGARVVGRLLGDEDVYAGMEVEFQALEFEGGVMPGFRARVNSQSTE